MTAIRPSNSELRDMIKPDEYNATLNIINATYVEMDKFIANLESDITSIKDFESSVLADQVRGYDVGTSLDTLRFQKESLQIDLDFFVHMKQVYIKKLYGDLYQYCEAIVNSAMSIEDLPRGTTQEQMRTRKFRDAVPYPPRMIPNPAATMPDGSVVEDVATEIPDPLARYDMNEIFNLIATTASNLRELADDINSFGERISVARDRETRGFSVGNLIMNLESQQQKLKLEFTSSISRLTKFLDQNKNFSTRCLSRIKIISSEIVTAEEAAAEAVDGGEDGGDVA
jgi:hypothetical protein